MHKNTEIQNYVIKVPYCDLWKNMKISSIFSQLQEVAETHSELMGLGKSVFKENNITWVLTRIKIEITRLPKADEHLVFETWPLKNNLIQFLRDFYVKNEAGEILIRATSRWCSMDLSTRHPVSLKKIGYIDKTDYRVDRAIECALGNIESISAKAEKINHSHIVRYSDIDCNGHMNNARYADLAMNCFSINELPSDKIASIQINYMNELKEGDAVDIYKESQENAYILEGKIEDRCIFQVEIKTRK